MADEEKKGDAAAEAKAPGASGEEKTTDAAEKPAEKPKAEAPVKPAAEKKAPAKPKGPEAPQPAEPPAGNVKRFEESMRDAIVERTSQVDQWSFTIKPERIADACRLAKESLGFDHLACLTAADYLDPEEAKKNYPPGASPPEGPPRIEVIYNLYGYDHGERMALRVKLPRDNPQVWSVADVWKGADWLEREVYDLFGVHFEGHPDLKRIMLPEGWQGHPLRKDYDRTKEQFVGLDPVTGEDVVSFDEGKGW